MLIANVLKKQFPIGTAIAEILGTKIIDAIKQQPAGRPVAEAVTSLVPELEEIAKKNPEIINQMNLEPLSQSRVMQGSVVVLLSTLIGAGAHLASMVQGFDGWSTFNFMVAGTEVITILGVSWTIIGRVVSGLKPMFYKGA